MFKFILHLSDNGNYLGNSISQRQASNDDMPEES